MATQEWGGKNQAGITRQGWRVIQAPDYVILHMIEFPETPTVSDARTSYSSSAIYGNCMCIISPWQKPGSLELKSVHVQLLCLSVDSQ